MIYDVFFVYIQVFHTCKLVVHHAQIEKCDCETFFTRKKNQKQNNISMERLYSLKKHMAKNGAAFGLQHVSTGFYLINGIESGVLLHLLITMVHTLQTRICIFKGKTHVSMNVSARWHSCQTHVVLIQKQFQSRKTAYCIDYITNMF